MQSGLYISGVGTEVVGLKHVLYGILGRGILSRILLGYLYLSTNFTPRETQIVLVGFSRGAYTARALAEFICTMGLLPPGIAQSASGHYEALRMWTAYRRNDRSIARFTRVCESIGGTLPEWVASVRKFPSVLWRRGAVTPAQVRVEIHALAVFDTVGALGLGSLWETVSESMALRAGREDRFKYATSDVHANVRHIFHAVSRDDTRWSYAPTVVDPAHLSRSTILTQQLFPGSHADVGGGWSSAYDPRNPHLYESALSDVVLLWMIEQLRAVGVTLRNGAIFTFPNPLGVAHHNGDVPDILQKPRELPLHLVNSPSGCLLARFGKMVLTDGRVSKYV